ncbi:MAG TPA: cytochrome P450 [Terriglobia bacterium]|nr:cytochrome P450 [Terriglobia bacterium]
MPSSSSKLPPGPPGRFLFGNALELSRNWMDFLVDCARKYGDAFFSNFFNAPICLLAHPDYIEHVLVTNQSNFVKSRDYRVLSHVMGEGLLTAEGETWRRQRKLVQPVFHHENLVKYGKVMLDCATRMLDSWEDGAVRDIHKDMVHLTLEIVTRALFGTTVLDRAGDVVPGLQSMMEEFTRHANLSFILPEFVPLPVRCRLRRSIKVLDDVFYSIIRSRRIASSDQNDLLDALFKMRLPDGHPMSDRELRDEMMTLLLTGHETTAVALSWTWYPVAQNKQTKTKLDGELNKVLGDREPTVGDIPRLRYTECVIKESMRSYPPAWRIGRGALADFEVGGYRLPAEANVFPMQWITHRDERFYPEPERFRPERWDEAVHGNDLPRFAYFPFGGGPRKCIGASFAMMEAVLLLAAFARKVRLDLSQGAHAELLPSLALRPRFGLRMIVHKRNHRVP